MLAQSFISAAELGITEPQRDALQKVLVLLETGKLAHSSLSSWANNAQHPTFTGQFNMMMWSAADLDGCGTICCIGGTAELVGNVSFDGWYHNDETSIYQLFRPAVRTPWCDITTTQAARALRSYLTTGDAKWAEAVA